MNQDPSPPIESLPDERISGSEMLQQILVLDVVDLDDQVLVLSEQRVVQRQSQHRDDVRDVRLRESLLAAEREDPTRGRESAGCQIDRTNEGSAGCWGRGA